MVFKRQNHPWDLPIQHKLLFHPNQSLVLAQLTKRRLQTNQAAFQVLLAPTGDQLRYPISRTAQKRASARPARRVHLPVGHRVYLPWTLLPFHLTSTSPKLSHRHPPRRRERSQFRVRRDASHRLMRSSQTPSHTGPHSQRQTPHSFRPQIRLPLLLYYKVIDHDNRRHNSTMGNKQRMVHRLLRLSTSERSADVLWMTKKLMASTRT